VKSFVAIHHNIHDHHHPQFINTCFFPLFPFFFPLPTPSSTSSLSPTAGLAPPLPHALATGVPAPSRLTIPLPYPKMVLCGFAAGGSAGNSPPTPLPGPLLAGLEVGGVGLADAGFEEGADEDAAHDTVLTFVDVALGRVGAGGRVGKGLFDVVEPEVIGGEAVPQLLVCETDERLDCAVLDFNFNTRVDFVFVVAEVDEEDGLAEVTAQFSGIEEDELPLAAGREG
jgi:hypothetical protein